MANRVCWIFLIAYSYCHGLGFAASRHRRSAKCYDDLGCFSNAHPFNNTDGLLPQRPEVINTVFRLYTLQRAVHPEVISRNNPADLARSAFDPELPVKIIIHGFLQHGQVAWVRDMADELLRKTPMNVITVDWGNGAGFPYSQAAANTRVVGAEVAQLIQLLKDQQDVSASNVHLIGHSLGAHVAGYAGTRIPRLVRITGLDPAEPDFEDTDNVVHLEKTDAVFVDIIHSDGSEFDYVSGFGMIDEVGHIDFYPNGGENQPGCPLESVTNIMSTAAADGLEDAEDVLSCSHSRSIYLFTESINGPCPFYAFPCRDMAAVDTNEAGCLQCGWTGCPVMGYNADQTNSRGKYYLKTRPSAPFCGFTQHAEIRFGSMTETTGRVRLTLVGEDQTTDSIEINSGSDKFGGGETRDALWVDRERIDDITSVRVQFIRPMGMLWWWTSYHTTPRHVSVNMVTVTAARTGRKVYFCGDNRAVSNGNMIELTRKTTNPQDCRHTIAISYA